MNQDRAKSALIDDVGGMPHVGIETVECIEDARRRPSVVGMQETDVISVYWPMIAAAADRRSFPS